MQLIEARIRLFRVQNFVIRIQLLREGGSATIARMVLLAFLSALALVLVALTISVIRGLRFWRQVKRTGRAFSTEIALFDERSARTERLLANSGQASEELEAALARLRSSRARVQVLLDSVARAKKRVGWLRAFFPA